MKTFQYSLGGQQLTITLDEKHGTIAEALVDGAPIAPTADEMPYYAAAIALALIEYDVEEVHDEETNIITVNRYATPWNSPSEMMTQL